MTANANLLCWSNPSHFTTRNNMGRSKSDPRRFLLNSDKRPAGQLLPGSLQYVPE